jgi:hypothetical protein
LITANLFRAEAISSDEINNELLEHLQTTYKGHKSTTLKYKNSDRKDIFRKTIIEQNQLQFNNCLTEKTENTIKKFFDSIDISDYDPSTSYFKKEEEERKSKETWINTDEIKEEPILYEPPPPPTPIKTPLKPTKAKQTKPTKPTKPEQKPDEIISKELKSLTNDFRPTPPPPPPYEADYDSDIESDIKALELKESTDQDVNTPDDIKKWKTKINKLWIDDITEIFENINYDDDDDDDENEAIKKIIKKYNTETDSIIKTYITRTKSQTRGSKAEIGAWAVKNPVSLKKVITSIVKTIKKKAVKAWFEEDYD